MPAPKKFFRYDWFLCAMVETRLRIGDTLNFSVSTLTCRATRTRTSEMFETKSQRLTWKNGSETVETFASTWKPAGMGSGAIDITAQRIARMHGLGAEALGTTLDGDPIFVLRHLTKEERAEREVIPD